MPSRVPRGGRGEIRTVRRVIRIGFNARCLVEPDMRGLSRYTVNLLRCLSRHEDVELVLFSNEDPCSGHLKGIRAKVVVFPASRETLWNDVALPRMIRKERVDLFHAPADRGLPLRKSCPFVVTVHDSYERAHWRDLFPTTKSRLLYWKNEMVNYLLADMVLTVSETTRSDLIRFGVAPARKIRAIPLAPAEDFTSVSGDSDDAVLRKYGVGKPYILYVGGYDRRKNVASLVQAFDHADLPGHELVIVARKIWDYDILVERWKRMPGFGRIRCLEVAHSEVPAFYRHAEFFVNPSLWESFSFQLVESMACGTPLLASNRKAIPEIAGDAAEYFDPDDVDFLARSMERMAGDAVTREGLRRIGYERVKSYSWTKTSEATFKVYKELVWTDVVP